ncbi:MAG: hypothetical protein KJ731_15820, partial [Alphaproteobacteria bacterium]|nr:hypothetical protein [Alphaproteobacteria bacterium]
ISGKLLSETDMSAGIRDAIANARTLVTVLTAAQAAAQRQAEAKGDRNSLQSQYAMYGAGHDAMVSSQTEASYAPDGGWGNKFKAPSSSKSSSGKSDAQKYQNDLMREGIRLTESLRTAQEKYNDEAERAKELLDSGAISTETFTRRMAELADELNGDSFKKIEDSLKSLSDDLANAIVNGDSLGDVLEASFKQAAAAYISSGLQNAFMGIFGGSSGGGLGGFISSILGVSNGGYASGGYTGDGGKYDPAGVVHRGEYVFNQKAVKAAGGPSALEGLHRKLNSGYATGGYVGSGASAGGTSKVSVEIYVNDDGTLGAIARQYGAEGGAAVAVQTVNKNNRKIAEQQRRPT